MVVRYSNFIIGFLLFSGKIISQQPLFSFKIPPAYNKHNFIISYFDSISNGYHINLQNGFNITRQLYDTNFKLLDEYNLTAGEITLSEKEKFIGSYFISPVYTEKGTFEIYSDKNMISVYKNDFEQKKDILIETLSFSKKQKEEKILTLFPDGKGFKIIAYKHKENTIKIYQWLPDQALKTLTFTLPESTLSKEEEKKYTKFCRINFKDIGPLKACKLNDVNSLPSYNHVLFSDKKVYFILGMMFSVGIYVMELDLENETIKAKNYFINSMKVNAGDKNNIKKFPISTIFDSILVIQNSSRYEFEFHFYNVHSHELIKSYIVPVKDSIYELVHSAFIQKGTYGSSEQKKELENENAFMRKINGDFSFISIASLTQDSVVFTLASLQHTEGIEGTLLSFATMPLGYMANIQFGNIQIIPYLTSSRNKLFYVHSKFSTQTFSPSPGRSVRTTLDDIMQNFTKKEIAATSTFLIQSTSNTLIGLFNSDNKVFEVYKFVNHD